MGNFCPLAVNDSNTNKTRVEYFFVIHSSIHFLYLLTAFRSQGSAFITFIIALKGAKFYLMALLHYQQLKKKKKTILNSLQKSCFWERTIILDILQNLTVCLYKHNSSRIYIYQI